MVDAPVRPYLRLVLRVALAAVYFGVGAVHLYAADKFLPIVPLWVPYPHEMVLATGVCEIAGAAGLLTRRLRRIAGLMLALYAICVFPANLRHAFAGIDAPPIPSSWWYHGPRLLFQPVFVWWALFAGGLIDWPWRRKSSPAR